MRFRMRYLPASLLLSFLALLHILFAFGSVQAQSNNGWDPTLPQPNGPIFKLLTNRGYSLSIVGGRFDSIGRLPFRNIAIVSQSSPLTFAPMGSGVNGDVLALIGNEANTMVFAGGRFDAAGGVVANHIAFWNGSSWLSLGSGAQNGVDAAVHSIIQKGDSLLVGGEFLHAGGVLVNHVAIWRISQGRWLPLVAKTGAPGVDNTVNSIALLGSSIYLGGDFGSAGQIAANHIVQFSNGSWSSLGAGIDGAASSVKIIATDALGSVSSLLYVGGNFGSVGGIPASNIAIWNSATLSWSAVSNLGNNSEGVHGVVNDLVANRGDLAVTGSFDSVGGIKARNLASFTQNGGGWSEYADGIDATGFTLGGTQIHLALTPLNVLWVGGGFQQAGEIKSPFLAYYELVRGVENHQANLQASVRASPNPFTARTTISYTTAHRGMVQVDLYDPLGRLVERAVEPQLEAGKHTFEFSAKDATSGIYLLRLSEPDGRSTTKLLRMK